MPRKGNTISVSFFRYVDVESKEQRLVMGNELSHRFWYTQYALENLFFILLYTMSLEVQINNDIKQAMLNKEKDVLESLRAIKSAILLLKTSKEAVDGQVPESAEVATLQKLVKQRREAAEIYTQQNRQDLADAEIFQANIIERYLPKQLSREEIESAVKSIIEQVGAASPKDMGKVMGVASKQFAGKADNKVVSEIVKAFLMSK